MKKNYKIAGYLILCIGILALLMNFTKIQAMIRDTEPLLSGVVIVLDAGHGGKDDGAQKSGVKEDEINLSLTLKLKTKLESAGASIVLTRDDDYDLASDGVSNRKRDDMEKRVAMINEEPSDLFISIHLNSFPNVGVHGGQVFYKKGDDASSAFAQIIQTELNTFMNQTKSTKSGDYYILNETDRPGVLVECGYLSNEQEREKLQSEEYQEQIADVLYQSVLRYLDVLTI